MRDIEPIVYTTDGPTSTKIKVWGLDDDFTGQCSFAWMLLTDDGVPSDSGTITCAGDDYAGWDGNNNFPYTWVADNLYTPVTLITE